MNAPRMLLPIGLAAVALAAPAAATATPMSDGYAVNVASQSHDLGTYWVQDSHHFEYTWVDYSLKVTSRAAWTGSLPVTTSWNSTNVRQGATLPVGRMSPMLSSGKLRVTWTLNGNIHSWMIDHPVDRTITVDAGCTPTLLGSTYECAAESQSIQILRSAGIPNGAYVNLKLKAKFTVTPEGAIVSRSLTTAGMDPVSKSGLTLSPVPVNDTVDVPCALAGSPVAYKLGPLHWTPTVTVTQQPRIEMGAMDPVLGQVELPAYADKPYGSPIKAYPAFDLTSSGHTTQLGSMLPNNVAPTIAPMTFYASAGQPEYLTADTSSRCDIASYVWKFADGTTAYGERPAKTYSKPGTFTGQLKVTDASGLSATRDFSVIVSA
jgi:hypothetical protein